jgi:hypothetical protein
MMAKKQLLRDTPFFGKSRYRRFKREMAEHFGVTALNRKPVEKEASVMNLKDPEVRERFKRFLRRKDMVGHRTNAGDEVIKGGRIMSAKELHSKGLLKSMELGRTGKRGNPGEISGKEREAHLKENVYATRNGLMKALEYGDTAVLALNRKAEKSPYMNLMTDEVIIPPKDAQRYRALRIGKGYILAPRKKITEYEKIRPGYKYVATEDVDDELKKQLYKPTRSAGEVNRRWLPNALKGKLRINWGIK